MAINTAAPIVRESQYGHRRGVILGLTMAETMLLLLFCLLLVAASVVNARNEQIEKLDGELKAALDLNAKWGLAFPGGAVAVDLPSLKAALALLAGLAAKGVSVDAIDVPTLAAMSAEDIENLGRLHELYPDGKIPDENWKKLVEAKSFAEALAAAGGDLGVLNEPPLVEALAETAKPGNQQTLAEALARAAEGAQEADRKGHEWPPIITLDDDGYAFAVGSAEVTAKFSAKLRGETSDQILALIREYDIDIVEVVGHTDEQPIAAGKKSNMDKDAIDVLAGRRSAGALVPADNAGLGLARAIAVAHILRASGKLDDVKIIPFSGAQLTMRGDRAADGSQAGDQAGRRRIEIRTRRAAN